MIFNLSAAKCSLNVTCKWQVNSARPSVFLVLGGNRAISCFVGRSLEMQVTTCAGLKNVLKMGFYNTEKIICARK